MLNFFICIFLYRLKMAGKFSRLRWSKEFPPRPNCIAIQFYSLKLDIFPKVATCHHFLFLSNPKHFLPQQPISLQMFPYMFPSIKMPPYLYSTMAFPLLFFHFQNIIWRTVQIRTHSCKDCQVHPANLILAVII